MERRDKTIGHASDVEAEEITALRKKAAAGVADNEELLRLALQLFEPGHDAFAAVDVLKELLHRDPECDLARIWLAYLYVYEFMDEHALRDAVSVANEVSQNDARLRAAALLVKGAALRHLEELHLAVEALEESVRLADDWVVNRQALGDIYNETDRKGEAAVQFAAALANFTKAQAKRTKHATEGERELFEIYFTGHEASDLVGEIIRDQVRAAKK